MFGMIGSLLSFLTGIGQTIQSVEHDLTNERIAMGGQQTDRERIASQERIATLTAQKDALIASMARSRLPIWIQALFAIPPGLYYAKLWVWDKMLQSITNGSTDPISPEMHWVSVAVIGFYFLTSKR